MTLLKLDETIQMCVLEMGMSERGEIELLSEIAKPEVAVITNVGESHLEQLGSREEIAKAKLEICTGLSPGGLLIYNGDEPLLKRLVSRLDPQMKRFRFGAAAHNDYYPTGIMIDHDGCHFTTNIESMPACFIPLLGKHNVTNSLAAIAVGKFMGVQEADIIDGLSKARITGMRIEVVKGYNGATLLNDAYNSSPTSLQAALQLLEELKGYNTKIAVIGDMLELGEQEEQFHLEIGKLLKPDKIDYIFTYGKLAKHIAAAAAPRYAAKRVQSLYSKLEIAEEIMRITDSNDLVLVKGSRGMELEEIISYLTLGSNHAEGGGQSNGV